MRLVHEIHSDAQTTVSGRAYAARADDLHWPGMHVEALATWTDPLSGQEEALHVEGDLDKFRAMLRAWLVQLDFIETDEKARFAASTAQPDKLSGSGGH
jgi:hypothetical protein